VLLNASSNLVENKGFGVLHKCTNGCQGFSGDYPQQTFQFMAAYNEAPSNGTNGIYFAAHDPTGASKSFSAQVQQNLCFGMSQIVPDAGSPISVQRGFQMDFPVVLVPFDGDWFDASQIYRAWSQKDEVSWLVKGPIKTRSDYPDWLFGMTTWVNSHWQQNDIFSTTGGDPAVVLQRVRALHERLDLGSSLGLHWYEWDTLGYKKGSNYTQCNDEITCGFDTHYPEYFPVRDGFQAALQDLQSLQPPVRVAPYINGRIFDQGTKIWHEDSNAKASAAKHLNSAAYVPVNEHGQPVPSTLSTYNESYGSKAVFSVMCPHTEYWQSTIGNVAQEVVQTYGTDGIYIDQIAAAGPRPCWDPTHNHSLGGGDHWVTGYREMLRRVRVATGNNSVILTESNAEPFMDGINLYLSLVGFASPFSGSSHIVNVFNAVYGGFYLAVGAKFFAQDLELNPNVFSAKVAKQFTFGAQLGWFSLGGRTNQDPYMGMYELLISTNFDPEISFLRKLSKAKLLASEWLTFGRTMRSVPLRINGSNAFVPSEAPSTTACNGLEVVQSAAFLSQPSAGFPSLLIALISPLRPLSHCARSQVDFGLDTRNYGLLHSVSQRNADIPTGRCKLTKLLPQSNADIKEQHLQHSNPGVFPCNNVSFTMQTTGHDVVLLRIDLLNSESP